MIIGFKKSFIKRYAKLRAVDRDKVDNALRLFEQSPNSPVLKNHALNGVLAGKRSIRAGNDLRLIFEIEGDYVLVVFIDVGSHNQVY